MEARTSGKALPPGVDATTISSPAQGRCNVVPGASQRTHLASQATSAFVQAAISVDQQRGSKQMVAQCLTQSTHVREMASHLGGRPTHFNQVVDQQYTSTCTTTGCTSGTYLHPPSSTALRGLTDSTEKPLPGTPQLYSPSHPGKAVQQLERLMRPCATAHSLPVPPTGAPVTVSGSALPSTTVPAGGVPGTQQGEEGVPSEVADSFFPGSDLQSRAMLKAKPGVPAETVARPSADIASGPVQSPAPAPALPTPPENTLIILDYDDTLLPTNWAAVQNRVGLNDPVPPEMLPSLAELSELCIQTINICLARGMVVIVTNATVEWVNRSGEKFIPQVLRHIQTQGIEIISARDRLQHTGMPQRQWKIQVFEEMINDVFGDRMRDGTECTVISIGDGEGEREACLEMCRNLGVNEWLFKSLKLLAQPTCNQLISEHLLVQQAFPEILKVPQSLDMAILDYKNCGGADSAHQTSVNPPAGHAQPASTPTVPSTSPSFSRSSPTPGNLQRKPSMYNGSSLTDRGTVVSSMNGHGGTQKPRGAAARNGVSATALYPKSAMAGGKSEAANTDAFVDLISDQLKSQHEPGSGLAGSMPIRRNSSFATTGYKKANVLRR
ncbi:hypothetical protein TGPRC2_289910 [Toxoplasma gondii TgCatPRC2]|uniref:Uncharacterized protein n=4 Tax=Toxoplasma gondii TaxID=5811 RepID=A0A151HJN4_TOXGO|nr:hypothetical protein TGME49_289910 [Toxoplasma gondii ME49]EPT27987.1 hypothetical protein TGME49_289910 [Toxoplasma gondii ME49]KYF45090.1 hypothetical protein TGARI_289910 [Toxoplasma gondii ARI]KYK69583.1 hypothetical protein TGPRC2_289910 [Toxoplasma gondii TgCatPRC2]PIM01632.1 hypothetical protein TGCOUG_289910 [Toxoplasma gondii COUG]|eukprot:XP_002368416.1 hypothetical protein TGME49_289910 [Toxoplasma gondii ME49]